MNLQQVIEKLGDKHYALGRPAYFFNDDEEMQPVRIHARSVLKMDTPAMLEKLREKDSAPGIAIAYGGLIGIDIAAAQNATGLLLLDINPEQKHFWRATAELIKECPTAAEFKTRFSAIEARHHLRQPLPGSAEPYPSFMEHEPTYQKVRGWALSGNLAATDMDALDTPRHQQLAAALREGRQRVGSVFLTNIPYFFNTAPASGAPPGQRRNFYSGAVNHGDYEKIFENQRLIATPHTRVIYADSCTDHVHFPLKEHLLSQQKAALAR